MVISKYLESVAGTEQEPVLLRGLIKLTENEEVAKLMDMPGVGKIFTALAALGHSDSVADFMQTEDYNAIKDWGITVIDLEEGGVAIYPGPKHVKRALTVAAVAGGGLMLFKLYRKYRRNCCR